MIEKDLFPSSSMLTFLFFPDVMLKPYQGTLVVSLAFSCKKDLYILHFCYCREVLNYMRRHVGYTKVSQLINQSILPSIDQ